jgi:hypothetical protein
VSGVLRACLRGALLAALACIADLSCGVQDVEVAYVDGGLWGKPCASSDQCTAKGYCMKTACDQTMGVCEPVPLVCSDQVDRLPPDSGRAFPPCGCPGNGDAAAKSVLYWNDCLRQQAREPASQACVPTPCQGPGDCPAGTFCNLGPAPCGSRPGFQGECWALPQPCPPDLAFFAPCAPGECMDPCTAIKTERPYEFGTCPQFGRGPMMR